MKNIWASNGTLNDTPPCTLKKGDDTSLKQLTQKLHMGLC